MVIEGDLCQRHVSGHKDTEHISTKSSNQKLYVPRRTWLLFVLTQLSAFVCHLVFGIPLHAARRAMAAALPPPKGNGGLF